MTRATCVAAAVIAAGCGCDLEATEEELAGEDAKDCGLSEGDRLASAWECAIASFERNEPFRVSWFGQSMDTTELTSLVSNGNELWQLELDDDRGPAEIYGWDCIAPTVRPTEPVAHDPSIPSGYDRIVCGFLEPKGNYYQVCGPAHAGSTEPLPFDP